MNAGQLQAWAAAHKTPLLAGTFGGAALLGLRARSKGASSTGSGNAGAAAGEQTFAGAGGAYYDSTANDVYNAIEPQIAALASQFAAMQATQGNAGDTVATPPAPTPVPPSAEHVPVGTKWGVLGTGHVGSPPPAVTPRPVTHSGGGWGTTGAKA